MWLKQFKPWLWLTHKGWYNIKHYKIYTPVFVNVSAKTTWGKKRCYIRIQNSLDTETNSLTQK